jgi:hypothetical protein
VKAKDLAEAYRRHLADPPKVFDNQPAETTDPEELKEVAIGAVCRDLVYETLQLIAARRVQSSPGIVAVVSEQHSKFVAFLRLVGEPAFEPAYKVVLQDMYPHFGPFVAYLKTARRGARR